MHRFEEQSCSRRRGVHGVFLISQQSRGASTSAADGGFHTMRFASCGGMAERAALRACPEEVRPLTSSVLALKL